MNLTNLILWSTSIILGWASVRHIDDIHRSILKAQARLVYESRTETWGTPKFLSEGQRPHEIGRKTRLKGTCPNSPNVTAAEAFRNDSSWTFNLL